MIVYAVIMFAASILIGVLAVLIYKGKTDLIHDYHQTKVTDKIGYGKAFGRAMAIIASAMAVSGAVSLFGEGVMEYAVAVLFVGFVIGIAVMVKVQKKYNGGIF